MEVLHLRENAQVSGDACVDPDLPAIAWQVGASEHQVASLHGFWEVWGSSSPEGAGMEDKKSHVRTSLEKLSL